MNNKQCHDKARKMNAEMSELIEQTRVHQEVHERKKKRKAINSAEEGFMIENDHSQLESGETGNTQITRKMTKKHKQNRLIGVEYDDHDNKVDNRILKSIFHGGKLSGSV
jgi:hypothetical protein